MKRVPFEHELHRSNWEQNKIYLTEFRVHNSAKYNQNALDIGIMQSTYLFYALRMKNA